MNKKYAFILFIFSFGLLSLTPLKAQVLDSAQAEKPTAVSTTDLTSEIELVTQRLKNIDRKTITPSKIEEIDSILPTYKEGIIKHTEAYKNFKKSHPNKQKVINLMNKWGSFNAHLSQWQQSINSYLNENSIIIEELLKLDEKWLLTYKKVTKENAPFEVTKLVSETRATIKSLIRKLNEQNNHFLGLETKVLILKEKIDAVINDLEHWKQSEEFSVLYQRHPVVWKAGTEKKHHGEKFDAWSSFVGNIKGVYFYLLSPENSVTAYIVSLLLMVFFFWKLKQSFKSIQIGESDNTLIHSKNIIVTNLWASITFTATIISIIYFSHTPNLLNEILLLSAMISTIPFVKPIAHPRFKGLVYFVVFLFFLNTIKSYVWYSSLFYRAYLFVEALLAIYIIYKMTHPYVNTRRLKVKPLTLFAIRLTPVLYINFVAAIVFNILGYTNFTDFLLKVGILGSVLSMVLFGMLNILSGFANGVSHYYFSQLKEYNFTTKAIFEKRALQWVKAFTYVFVIIYFLHVIDVYQYIVDWVLEAIQQPVQKDVTFTWGGIFSFFIILIGSFGILVLLQKL